MLRATFAPRGSLRFSRPRPLAEETLFCAMREDVRFKKEGRPNKRDAQAAGQLSKS